MGRTLLSAMLEIKLSRKILESADLEAIGVACSNDVVYPSIARPTSKKKNTMAPMQCARTVR